MSNTETRVVVFEGLPGGGKTTLTAAVAKIFKATPYSENGFFGSEELYLVSDFQKIERARKHPGLHFFDRSYLSTLAHSFSMLVHHNNYTYYDLVRSYFEKKIRFGLTPSIYIYIDVGVELSLRRKNRPFDSANIWTQPKHLETIKKFYDQAFLIFDPQVPVLKVRGDRSPKNIMLDIIRCIKDSKIKP